MAVARKRRPRSRRRQRRTAHAPRRARLLLAALCLSVAAAALTHELISRRGERPRSVRATIDYWAGHYDVDVHLARAVAWQESGNNPHVVSATGARGVMQVEPATWRYTERQLLGRRIRPGTEGNIRIGIAYLHHLLVEFKGNQVLALAAYYQGPRAVHLHGLYPSSRRYVTNVLALSRRL
jgi:soluble lytic murein transglycosylase-like protein